MRSAIPWLSSLILHSLFFVGMVILTSAPTTLPPLKLTLDFQLMAPELIQDEAEPVAKVPPPVQKVKEPPPPVPQIRAAKPVEIPKPVEPIVEPYLPEPEPVIAPVPPVVPVPVVPNRIVSDVESEVVKKQRYTKTVNHIRGQVLRKLTYPAIARRQGWRGSLVLSFTLCADGSVEALEVYKSSGHKILDRAALKAVAANTPFSGGYARTQVKLPITFQLN